jgi:hypothetical protein
MSKKNKKELKREADIKTICEFTIEVADYIEAKKIVLEFERKEGLL